MLIPTLSHALFSKASPCIFDVCSWYLKLLYSVAHGLMRTCLLESCSICLTVSTASRPPGTAIFSNSCSFSTRCACRWPISMAQNRPANLLRLSSCFFRSPVNRCILTLLHVCRAASSKAAEALCSASASCKTRRPFVHAAAGCHLFLVSSQIPTAAV